MRKLSLFLATTMLLTFAGIANAQKIASVDYEGVLTLMPATKTMQTELENVSKTKGDALDKLAADFQAKVENYQKVEGVNLTEDQRKAKEAELQKEQQNLQQLYATAENDLAKKRQDLLKPIIDSVNKAVETVAKANGYDFIFDVNNFIYRNGPDITDLVKKELKLQ
ncbi:MAG: OmpH family outer membrane protein [Flavobacteriaceae bacterium]|jgi:outer membrane protein|nr:OmpH family outer membrane protein [Flavobacteriaceae bacterium]